jgi:hypothetical protein
MHLTLEQKKFLLRLLAKNRDSKGVSTNTLYVELYRGIKLTYVREQEVTAFLDEAARKSLVVKVKGERWTAGTILPLYLNDVPQYANLV